MNRISKIFVRSCLFLCLTVTNNFIFAQGYGKITGSVVDELTSEPLPFTNITIQETALGSATDMDGKYIILKIPSGIYTVVAQYIGYNKVTVTYVEVLADLTTELNFKLQPSSVQLEGDIVITAQRNLVRKDITSTESRISAEDIEQLPVQEASQIIDLQAGVSRDADGDLHIRGGRSTEISYLINGISITDDYSREQVIRVETSSIQELQVISGTFNAEYGNALSGVINYITKTGNNNFTGNLEMWTGDYISSSEDIFWGIDELTPVANYNLIGTFSGPIVPDLLTFFGSLRRYYNDGWIYGENVYSPQGRYKISGTDTIPNPGNNELVSMSYEDLWSGQFSLELRPITAISFKIDFFGSKTDSRSYDHNYRLNPWGDNNTIDKSYSIFPKITHTLSNAAFYELAYAYRLNETNSKLYDDPYDSRYVHPDSANVPGFTFLRAGTDLNRFQRTTTSNIFKLDITNQLNSVHLIKLGADYQLDNLFYENIDLVPLENENGQEVVPFQPSIRGIDTPQA